MWNWPNFLDFSLLWHLCLLHFNIHSAQTYLQSHYGNGVFGNFWLPFSWTTLRGQTLMAPHCRVLGSYWRPAPAIHIAIDRYVYQLMGLLCDRLKLCSTVAPDCWTCQNKGRYHKQDHSFLLVSFVLSYCDYFGLDCSPCPALLPS